jgi:hypothetical protein
MDQANDHQSNDQEATAQTENTPIPELWTPSAAACLSFVFSPAFGACLNGLNWMTLGKPALAKRSFLWMIPGFVLPFLALFLLPTEAVGLLTLGYFLVWYLAEAKDHIAYVRENVAPDYPRRSWVLPLSCALVALALLVFSIGAMAEWSKGTGGSDPTRQTQSVEESLEEQAVGMVTKILASDGGYAYSRAPKCIRVKITEEIVDGFYRATATLDTGRDLPITIESKDGTIHVRTEL